MVLVGGMWVATPSAAAPGDRWDHELWLEEVEPLILQHERELFESLDEDYERDAFIREFWRVRDPYQQTGRNEFKERYLERLGEARARFPSLEDARSRFLLVHGEPSSVLEVRCTTTRVPAIVWAYSGSDLVRFSFALVFLRGRNGLDPATLWRPSQPGAIDSVVRSLRGCVNGGVFDQVIQRLAEQGGEYEERLDQALLKPRPRSLEWVASFRADSPRLPEGAVRIPASAGVDFVGRNQSRTVVQWLVRVAAADASVADFAGYRSYEFELVGEVVSGEGRLETFRYRFGMGEEAAGQNEGLLPLVFQRSLRPGRYRVVLRLEDLNSERFHLFEEDLEVPTLSESSATSPEAAPGAELFAEATRALGSEDTSIEIREPEGLQAGFVRFDTLATGVEIERVRFLLDGESVVTKNRPPFSVELDLGDYPRQQTLRVEALDGTDRIVAVDELEVNSGGERFSVRLVSPVGKEQGVSSVLARARLAVPRSAALDRVEFFVDDRLAATLYQEPWAQPLRVPEPDRPSYVRVVGHLADGSSAEDLVFVNGGEQVGERLDVQVVEVFAVAEDRFGRPVEGLGREDFEIVEDGVVQSIDRFEVVRDLPFSVGIVLDNSASMGSSLDAARRAALRFLERAVDEEDRAAVITFNRVPHLAVELTGDPVRLGAGFAGLSAEGETALYDSIMYSLYYFTGLKGHRAILLLTDGRDEVSQFDYAQTLEYARRAGVTVYAIGLGLRDGPERTRLRVLAAETGGASFFIRGAEELDEIYDTIEAELRSQYLLTYQSSNTGSADEFRTIGVEAQGATRVKAMSGYYP